MCVLVIFVHVKVCSGYLCEGIPYNLKSKQHLVPGHVVVPGHPVVPGHAVVPGHVVFPGHPVVPG